MDLIDREQAIAEMHLAFGAKPAVHAQAVNILNGMPSAEKTGKWVKDNNLYRCTACNNLCAVAGWANSIPEEQMYKAFKYCPNCGARMVDDNE